MSIGEFFAVLRRQWVLVLIGVLLSAGLTGAAYKLSPPTFEATGTVLFLPPPSSTPNGSNPYLQLGGLSQAVSLVGLALSDQQTQLRLQSISTHVQFTVQPDPRTSSPVLAIDVKDNAPRTALQMRDYLVAQVPVRLKAMQDALSIDTKDRVTSTVVTLDAQAQEVGRTRLRGAVVAAGLGLGLTLLVATLWDAHRVRKPRRSRRNRRGSRRAHQVAPLRADSVVDQEDSADDPDEEITRAGDELVAHDLVASSEPPGRRVPVDAHAEGSGHDTY